MRKKILITGGAGFIGSSLALELLSRGYDVTVLDNLSEQIHGRSSQPSFLYQKISGKVTFIHGDIRNREDWIKAIDNQDAIIHLAAETGTGQSMYRIQKYVDVNIGGTSLLWDILANQPHSIRKIVVASSRAIYGEGRYHCSLHGDVYPETRKESDLSNGDFECKCPECGNILTLLPTHEASRINPRSVYGITKYNQEQLCLVMGESLNIPVVAFRYQNVYGPGQSLSNPYTGILSIFSTQIKNNDDLQIFEDGNESRDFVYIDDVVDATIRGLEKEKADFKVYNVGSGQATTVLQVAKTLTRLYQTGTTIHVTGNFRIGDIRHNFADLQEIRADLDFIPKYSFEEGIQEFAGWVNTQDIQSNLYARSIQELKEKKLLK